jgi:preprotein translocase subunit YajC
MFLILMVLIVGAFYFLLIRPQKARQKQQQQMQKTLQPGARVMTTSGMFAHVVEVTDDGVVLEIAPGVEAEFISQAIMKVVEEEPVEEDVPEAGETAEAHEPVEDEVPAEAKTVEAKTDDIAAAQDSAKDEAEPAGKTGDKASGKPSA